jgi:hypothetical protein
MHYRTPFLLRAAALVFLSFSLCACVGTLPGGSDKVNQNFYDSEEVLQNFAAELTPGMTKEEAFARLGRTEKDFTVLSRQEIVGVIFGGESSGVPESFSTDEGIKQYLESLEGYRLTFKSIKRKHGFSSIIRIQTDSKGFDYKLELIFKHGRLMEKPVLTGGKVDSTSSDTIFDFLNPGRLLDASLN